VEIELIEDPSNPNKAPEVRVVTMRRKTPADRGPLTGLKKYVAGLPDGVHLHDLIKSMEFGDYRRSAVREETTTLTRALHGLVRNGIGYLGGARRLSRHSLIGGRNLGPRSAELLGELFELPE
jgi:hypothetical protein